MSLSLALVPDCGDSVSEVCRVVGGSMERHTETLQIYIVWLLIKKWKNTLQRVGWLLIFFFFSPNDWQGSYHCDQMGHIGHNNAGETAVTPWTEASPTRNWGTNMSLKVNLLREVHFFMFWWHIFIRGHATSICWVLVRLSVHLPQTSVQPSSQSGSKERCGDVFKFLPNIMDPREACGHIWVGRPGSKHHPGCLDKKKPIRFLKLDFNRVLLTDTVVYLM